MGSKSNINRGKVITGEVKICGDFILWLRSISAYTFALDSGASVHMVDQAILRNNEEDFTKLLSTTKIVTASGLETELEKVHSSAWSLGEFALDDLTLIVDDFSIMSEALGQKVHGILSLSELTNEQIVINTATSQFYF